MTTPTPTTIPLPEPWDYCYEWDGPFGTRKFSAASHNGNRPDRSVPLYTADQMHAHAAAVSAAKDAEIAALRADIDAEKLFSKQAMQAAQEIAAERDALREDAERLDFLLHKLPGDALRYVVGELSDTSNGAEFRAAIDAARKGEA